MQKYLGKYIPIRKLGKGSFGSVYEVQKGKNGEKFALKVIQLSVIAQYPELLEYLNGQIQCLKSLDSPYIMKLLETSSDKNYQYMVCQYCNGGDLINYQSRQENNVFTLKKSTQILSKVINGLQLLHSKGYLHRDIKPQNILVNNNNGTEQIKLADFGFCRKIEKVNGTILGTKSYQSPEIYSSQKYGYEVDMWAFGVVLYFMLNMESPFNLNANLDDQTKQKTLKKMATNFSYKQAVSKSKKVLLENCTNQTQDLFKKIFNPNGNQRITFPKICKHPLFCQYFSQSQQKQSQIIYSVKFENKNNNSQDILSFSMSLMKERNYQIQNITQDLYIQKKIDKYFPSQVKILELKKDQFYFLRDNASQIMDVSQLKISEKLAIVYNLLKYYIINMRNFIEVIKTNKLSQIFPKNQWNKFYQTQTYKNIIKQFSEDLFQAELKFEGIYEQCQYQLNLIKDSNPKFHLAFSCKIHQKDLSGTFKQSYRKSTRNAFNTMKKYMKNHHKGNKLNFVICLIVISHGINHIFQQKEMTAKIFKNYFQERKRNVDSLDYTQLREWMSKATPEKLNTISILIMKYFFS